MALGNILITAVPTVQGVITTKYKDGNNANGTPYFVSPPAALSFQETFGGTYNFAQHATDPNGDTLAYSLQNPQYTGIYINPSTGILTVGTNAVAAVRTITVIVQDPGGLSSNCNCTITISSISSTGARFTIPLAPQARSFSGGNFPLTNGGTGTPVAGDIIEFAAGTHGPITFTGLRGTAINRIIIRGPQTGGSPAIIRRRSIVNGGSGPQNGGFVFHLINCSYVTINGENPNIGTQGTGGWKCGLKVMYAEGGTDGPTDYIKYSAINNQYNSNGTVNTSAVPSVCHHITLRFVEVDGNYPTNPGTGGSGYGIRCHHVEINRYDAPYAATPAYPDGYYIEGDIFEYCYWHNLPKAVLYLGGNWIDTTNAGNYSSLPCRGMIVRHNWLENCGGGVHAKIWWKDGRDGTRNKIHDNYIKNCGQHHNSPHTVESIGVLSCTVDVYNNVVIDNAAPSTVAHDTTRPLAHAFRIITNNGPLAGTAVAGGYGVISPYVLNVYNNLITRAGQSIPNPGGSGISVSKDTGTVGFLAKVYNNTCYKNSTYGIIMGSVEAGSFIKNNICVLNTVGQISPSSTTGTVTVSNNIITGGDALFTNSTQGVDNFHLVAASSPLATGSIGVDYPSTDIGTPPHGTTNVSKNVSPDCGAYEKP